MLNKLRHGERTISPYGLRRVGKLAVFFCLLLGLRFGQFFGGSKYNLALDGLATILFPPSKCPYCGANTSLLNCQRAVLKARSFVR